MTALHGKQHRSILSGDVGGERGAGATPLPARRDRGGDDGEQCRAAQGDSAFDSWLVIPEDFIELPENRVLVLVENRAKTKAGVEMAEAAGAIWTVEGGLIRRLELFADRGRALEAAGLSE